MDKKLENLIQDDSDDIFSKSDFFTNRDQFFEDSFFAKNSLFPNDSFVDKNSNKQTVHKSMSTTIDPKALDALLSESSTVVAVKRPDFST